MTQLVVVGGGIGGLAAARHIEELLPDADVTLVDRSEQLGGKLLTEQVEGFLVEAGADSFLSRKPRGVGLCEELGLEGRLIGRRPEHARSFVRLGDDLHQLPEGLSGLVPTDLEALGAGSLLSAAGLARFAEERAIPPAPADGDESIASFVSRRFGAEAYERLVEPLLTGIYGGDGALLSLAATFPQLRDLELEHGSILAGLAAQTPAAGTYPAFVAPRGGTGELVRSVAAALERTTFTLGKAQTVRESSTGYLVDLDDGRELDADAVVLAVPAFSVAELVESLDQRLAAAHAEIPYASSAIVTFGLRAEDLVRPIDGYGYVVPKAESSLVIACTWSSSKWEGRAPAGRALVRLYLGRFGERDVTELHDEELVSLAREELRHVALDGEPVFVRIQRWPRGMPQYTLGHRERLDDIDAALEQHPRLALAGAAYRGVGIPDCILSGEVAAAKVARALAPVLR